MIEMERLRDYIDKMEEERSQLVAEVEAQIERALANMAIPVEMSDSEAEEGSQMLDSLPPTRPASSAGVSFARRSINTETTLADTGETDEETRHSVDSTIPEIDERDAASETNHSQRTPGDKGSDAMDAVDEGIHQNSDKIAQKVLQIQQKVRLRVINWVLFISF